MRPPRRPALAAGGAWLGGCALVALLVSGCATAGLLGRPAPDFVLPALGGGEVRLAAWKGQVAVIDFWASWCGPCREELPELEKLRQEYEPRGVRFVAINIDSERAAAEEAARSLLLAMPVGLDPGKQVADRYSPTTMPSSYLVDRAGLVRFVHEGWAGTLDVNRFRRELDSLLR